MTHQERILEAMRSLCNPVYARDLTPIARESFRKLEKDGLDDDLVVGYYIPKGQEYFQ